MDIHQIYIDYKYIYDSISRDQLIEIMKEFGVPSNLVGLVKMTLERATNEVEIKGKRSHGFETIVGPRQSVALDTL
jgi:hypothetical protein